MPVVVAVAADTSEGAFDEDADEDDDGEGGIVQERVSVLSNGRSVSMVCCCFLADSSDDDDAAACSPPFNDAILVPAFLLDFLSLTQSAAGEGEGEGVRACDERTRRNRPV